MKVLAVFHGSHVPHGDWYDLLCSSCAEDEGFVSEDDLLEEGMCWIHGESASAARDEALRTFWPYYAENTVCSHLVEPARPPPEGLDKKPST